MITHALAYGAAREALLAAAGVGATSFPVVSAYGSDRANRFSVKASSAPDVAGLKIGSFWPGNPAQGRPRHNSLILLFDQDTGRISTAIEASIVNAYCTAAADAVAAEALARPDATTLAIFGAGNQARYEFAALARVRPIHRVLVVARDAERGRTMAAELSDQGPDAAHTAAEAACAEADIIVTATSSTAPLFQAGWVRPGTHIASMGSDAAGKQELPPELFERAALFCDLPEQSRMIGEFQHAPKTAALTAIGHVLSGAYSGRRSPSEITIFDSSGLSLQDLIIAQHLLAKHSEKSA